MADNYIERKMAELTEKRRGFASAQRHAPKAPPQGYAAVPLGARRIFLALGPHDYQDPAKTFVRSGYRVAVALEAGTNLFAEAEKEGFRFCQLNDNKPESTLETLLSAWRDIDLAAISADSFSEPQINRLADTWAAHRNVRPNISDFPGLLILVSSSRVCLESLMPQIAPILNLAGINAIGLTLQQTTASSAALTPNLLWLAQLPAIRLNNMII